MLVSHERASRGGVQSRLLTHETLHEPVMRHEPSEGDGLWDWASAVYERWVSKAVRVPATTCRMVMVSSLGGYFLILRSIRFLQLRKRVIEGVAFLSEVCSYQY